MPSSAFAKFENQAWPYEYKGQLHVSRICGGIPSDPKVAEGWIRTKLGAQAEETIQAQVAEVMTERGISEKDAVKEVNLNRHLNGFKRQPCPACPDGDITKCEFPGTHRLHIEGRQLKAAIKEAASVAAATDKIDLRGWGKTRKGLLNFVAEHVCVVEDKLFLGTDTVEPTGVSQRFVHTFRGTGIQYEEYVDDAIIDFTIQTDYKFADRDWAMIWLTGEQQGIGATRSQGYGRYTVTTWDQTREPKA